MHLFYLKHLTVLEKHCLVHNSGGTDPFDFIFPSSCLKITDGDDFWHLQVSGFDSTRTYETTVAVLGALHCDSTSDNILSICITPTLDQLLVCIITSFIIWEINKFQYCYLNS